MKILFVDLGVPSLLKYRSIFPGTKLSVMFSYARQEPGHFEIATAYREAIDTIGYDSGTFTRFFSKNRKEAEKITLDGYKSFLWLTASYWDYYFSFDSNYTKRLDFNWDNQDYLEAAGLHPVPVIHDINGDDVSICIDRGDPLVAIGSGELKKGGGMRLETAVKRLFDHGIKIHLLGCTNESLLSSLPIYACDSSTASQNGGRSSIQLWIPGEGPKAIKLKDHSYTVPNQYYLHNHPRRDEFEDYIYETFGFEYNDLMGVNKKVVRDVINFHYYIQMERRITEAHKKAGFPTWQKRTPVRF
jgi:hypothetical protein